MFPFDDIIMWINDDQNQQWHMELQDHKDWISYPFDQTLHLPRHSPVGTKKNFKLNYELEQKFNSFYANVLSIHWYSPPQQTYAQAMNIINDLYRFRYYICWFNFDALAQGNAYIPTKEPINYRGPGGDRTQDLQTEATPPAASCPAQSLHATEIVS